MKKGLTPKEIEGLKSKVQAYLRLQTENRIERLYPDKGPLRRELYKPHMKFFRAGLKARERSIIAANGVGKTWGVGGYETVLHLTGLYPDWWQGRRFKMPIRAWVAGDTAQTVKEVTQAKLVGPPEAEGTGLIPKELIADIKKKPGSIPDAIESVSVKHVSGGLSHVTFKSYDQKRRSFQGTEREVIWLDEECPENIYDECLMRTRSVNGMVLLTFTPLQGLSPVVLSYMPEGRMPDGGWVTDSKFVVNATWEDAPHLTEKEKSEIKAGTLPHLIDARTKGIPTLGSGAIYPISEDEIAFDDGWLYREGQGTLPVWFKYANALDVGWNSTACVFGAYDDKNDIVYIYRVYKQGRSEPATHIHAITSAGDWIPTVCDPRADSASQVDGRNLLNVYYDWGLQLFQADNTVESGILAVWQRLVSGRLKVARSCQEWFNELRTYHRDEDGKIVKLNDHLMDATRYLVMSGLRLAMEPPFEDAYPDEAAYYQQRSATSGKSAWTGY